MESYIAASLFSKFYSEHTPKINPIKIKFHILRFLCVKYSKDELLKNFLLGVFLPTELKKIAQKCHFFAFHRSLFSN